MDYIMYREGHLKETGDCTVVPVEVQLRSLKFRSVNGNLVFCPEKKKGLQKLIGFESAGKKNQKKKKIRRSQEVTLVWM